MKNIFMSKEEEEDFLFRGRILRLATRTNGNSLRLVPIWYLYENGKIYIHTDGDSAKVNDIRKDDRVAMCVDVGESYYDLKNVKLRGKARILGDADLAKNIAEKIQVKYFGSCSHPQAREYLSSNANNVVIEIELSKWRHSEDFSRLLGGNGKNLLYSSTSRKR